MDKICASIFIYVMQFHFWMASTEFSGNSFVEIVRQMCFIVGCLCILLKWGTYGKADVKKVLLFLGLTIIVVCGMYVSGGLTVVKLLLFGLALKNVPFEYVLRAFSRINIAIGTLIWGAVLFDFIPNKIFNDGGENFYYLGFTNPNTAAMLFFSILISLTFGRIGSWKLYDYILCISTSYIMYSLTGSRAMLISASVYISFTALEQYGKLMRNMIRHKLTRKALYAVFPALTVLSYWLAEAYTTSALVKKLNLMFSWRFYLWNRYVGNIGIGLFGNKFDWEGVGTLDNGYLVLLFRYGLIIYLIYFAIFTYTVYCATKWQKYNILILMLTTFAYCFVEGYTIIININFLLIYFWSCFWKSSAVLAEKQIEVKQRMKRG